MKSCGCRAKEKGTVGWCCPKLSCSLKPVWKGLALPWVCKRGMATTFEKEVNSQQLQKNGNKETVRGGSHKNGVKTLTAALQRGLLG